MKLEIEIANPMKCPVCGEPVGKSNITYQGVEVWIACDCWPKDKIGLLNTKNLRWEGGMFNPQTGTIEWRKLSLGGEKV